MSCSIVRGPMIGNVTARLVKRSQAKLLAALLAFACAASPVACSDNGDTYINQSGGSAGTGGSANGGTESGSTGGTGSGGKSGGSAGSQTSSGGDSDGGEGGGDAGTGGITAGTGGITAGTSGSGGGDGGSTGSGGNPGALFVEDFEDGNYDGWALGPSPSTYAVTTATAANGSSSSIQITGGTGYFNGPNYMLGGIKPSTVSWWVRIADSLGSLRRGLLRPLERHRRRAKSRLLLLRPVQSQLLRGLRLQCDAAGG